MSRPEEAIERFDDWNGIGGWYFGFCFARSFLVRGSI